MVTKLFHKLRAAVLAALMAFSGPLLAVLLAAVVASKRDWLPGTREGRLYMAKKWDSFIDVNGARLHMSAAEVTAQHDAIVTLENAIEENIIDPSDHNRRAIAAADEAMSKLMRFNHEHYLLSPPLTEAEQADLLLRKRDKPTDVRTATNEGLVTKATPVGPYQLELELDISGVFPSWFKKRNYFYRILITVGSGEAAVQKILEVNSPKALVTFADTESGKPVTFRVCLVNAKKHPGPYGPVFPSKVP
jgi:hypothetical protein